MLNVFHYYCTNHDFITSFIAFPITIIAIKINPFYILRTVGVELDAQVSAAHPFGEEEPRAADRTRRHGLGSRRVQNVRVPGNDIYGRHSVPEPVGE